MNKYSFETAQDITNITQKLKVSVAEVVLEYSAQNKNESVQSLQEEMLKRLGIMRESIAKGLLITERSKSGLSGGDAKKLDNYSPEHLLLGECVFDAVKNSFAIMEHNARFGRIVAFPTAGSAGTVPGTLIAAQKHLGKSDEEIVYAMFVAAGIGMVTGERAMLAGAVGGCQAEVGSASAMAAGALTYLRGGSTRQIFDSAAICLKGMLGLVCDPIGGLVEAPCVKRNSTGISNAFMSSEIVMAGVESNVNYDEVVGAMKNVASLMSDQLKETAKGGLATTPTGLRIAKCMSCNPRY